MKKLIAILMLTLVTVFAFAGGWKNIYSGTSFTELQVDGSCRIVMWDATDKDGGYMNLQNLADFIFNQTLVTNFQVDSVTAEIVIADGLDVNGTSAGADINYCGVDLDYDQGAVAGGAYLSRGNIYGARSYVDAIGNLDHAYSFMGGSYMAMAANTEVNQFYGGQFSAHASGAFTMTLHDGLVGSQSSVYVDAGVADITGGLVAALFTYSSEIAKNVTAPTYGIYQKTGGYTDYGINVQVEANHTSAGLRVQASESAVLPIGIQINTNVGTITADLSLQNDETIDNATDGVINVAAANVRAATYNFADSTTVGGTGDAITIDFTPDLTCTFGTIIYFIAEHTNTTAVTLNVDGGGNDAVIEAHDLSALDANDIRDKMPIQLMYNDTSWVQISQSGN